MPLELPHLQGPSRPAFLSLQIAHSAQQNILHWEVELCEKTQDTPGKGDPYSLVLSHTGGTLLYLLAF
ncbi:hypothetical protein GOBAR_DD07615 [Gossypium barbadense]|nr:hypothetical protein GOBAR_DD07615 [Gossypium barbadense]